MRVAHSKEYAVSTGDFLRDADEVGQVLSASPLDVSSISQITG